MLSERLKIFRTALGLNQKEIAEKLNITQAGYGKYELGNRDIPNIVFDLLIKNFKLNPIWIFTGTGTMFLDSIPAPDLPLEDKSLLDDAKDLIKKHAPKSKEIILHTKHLDYSGRSADSKAKDKDHPAIDNIREFRAVPDLDIELPHYLSRVCAGNGSFVFDSEIESFINFKDIAKKDTDFILTVSGDSMIYEGIYDGDRVIVRAGLKPKLNQFVVAKLSDESYTLKKYIKEGKDYWLAPGNRHYPAILFTEDMEIAGVVTGIFRGF